MYPFLLVYTVYALAISAPALPSSPLLPVKGDAIRPLQQISIPSVAGTESSQTALLKSGLDFFDPGRRGCDGLLSIVRRDNALDSSSPSEVPSFRTHFENTL
ncbi:hypothetical protein CLAFUW4_20008 [Fulvia fulva]|uniref:uncharacterized protein n=1 Tax=Passalora fulva TaxID=5499 RepID=UPI0028528270|nr:uncharacterized protein CLAFUR5_20008 [Fulvia fulva]KAK4636307.1 hypothetical protein CLAFUR4_20008 [Fulvia fulva]KAK4637207.1 hypothetical protein CLAFUR0_20008 [Fulvia fulva]WMI38765.1 hypothetical protein CLAFUR5_20008 [Fulvia fulva]WPV08506.1 hypothetical protein CLAFUW4_20008 [Fulvia fulva]WPV25083.1 hypothetical protein CLAFUW7_20008 [Fulvia fulva]